MLIFGKFMFDLKKLTMKVIFIYKKPSKKEGFICSTGANDGNRTRDLTLTMGVLYLLSYIGDYLILLIRYLILNLIRKRFAFSLRSNIFIEIFTHFANEFISNRWLNIALVSSNVDSHAYIRSMGSDQKKRCLKNMKINKDK